MTFTPEIPKEPGAYWWRAHEHAPVRLREIARAPDYLYVAQTGETLSATQGLWHRLHSGDEVAELCRDLKLMREQCRVGDVAFQHLHCTSHGQPIPDWVKDGLPNLYLMLEELTTLKADNARLRQEVGRAHDEGWEDRGATWPTGHDRYDTYAEAFNASRAKRVAEGEFPQ